MRLASSLLATLALISSLPVLAPRLADACGGYGPRIRMFAISQRHGHTFLLVDHVVPDADKLTWTRGGDTAPTYDSSLIAAAPPLPTGVKLTLAGASGVRTVTTSRRAFLSRGWDFAEPTSALEISTSRDSDFTLAVQGEHDVAWIELASATPAKGALAWTAPLKIDPRTTAVRHADEGDVDLVTSYVDGETRTFLAVGGAYGGEYLGTPLGAVVVDGMRYVTILHNGMITPVAF